MSTSEEPRSHRRLTLPRSTRARVAAALAIVVVIGVLGMWWQGRNDATDEASRATIPDVTLPPTTAADLSNPDERFWQTISEIDALATRVPGQANAVSLAKNVCSAIEPTMTVEEAQEAATAVLTQASIRAVAVPYWAGAATAAFCPEFSDLMTGQ